MQSMNNGAQNRVQNVIQLVFDASVDAANPRPHMKRVEDPTLLLGASRNEALSAEDFVERLVRKGSDFLVSEAFSVQKGCFRGFAETDEDDAFIAERVFQLPK